MVLGPGSWCGVGEPRRGMQGGCLALSAHWHILNKRTLNDAQSALFHHLVCCRPVPPALCYKFTCRTLRRPVLPAVMSLVLPGEKMSLNIFEPRCEAW